MSTDDWFKNTVLYKRYLFIVLWNLIIQVFIVWALKILDVLFSPVVAIVSLPIATAIYCQINLSILLSCLCGLFFQNVKVYPELPGTPISIICRFLRPQNWLHSALFATLGALWSQCLLAASANTSYQTLRRQSSDDVEDRCVNEYHFFVFLHGAFLGLSFHCVYQIQHLYCLKFDSVQQLKLPTAKAYLKTQVKKSFILVTKKVRYFYLIYYLFGFIPKYFVSHVLGQPFCDGMPLSTLSGLFDLQLLLSVCLVGVAVYASWTVALSLVQIFLTEHFSFPIEATLEKDRNKLLINALSERNSELVQHLAFQNLATIAQYSSTGRQKIFAVSIPGGHPHTWNEISSRCLQVIDQFQSSLCQAIYTSVANCKPVATAQPSMPNYLGQSPQNSGLARVPLTSTPLSTSLKLPQAARITDLRTSFNARNMVDKDFPFKAYSLEPKAPFVKIDKMNTICKGIVTNTFNKGLDYLMNKPVIKFLTVEPNERKLERLVCSCQLVIWSVQALTFLVRASYTEDQNGVVQWKLAKIISSILELQMALERCPKGMLRNNISRETFFTPPKNFSLKQSLNAAINSGLYYITCTFKSHLKYIELSDEHRNRIERYLQMKE